ncbi:MAG: hypothetical protein QOG51_1057 [Verrucomicrobiota bacterium]|jgi:hypothetical protein
MASHSVIEAIVIRNVQNYPYPEEVTLDSPLGTFFKEGDDIDKHQNRPIHRVDLFLRDLKKDLGAEIPVTRDDLLDVTMFPKVDDLVAIIAAELED